MNSRRYAIVLLAAVLAAGAFVFVNRSKPSGDGVAHHDDPPGETPRTSPRARPNEALEARLVNVAGLSDRERDLVRGLVSRLSGSFEEPRIRLAFLERLAAELERMYPDTWLRELERLLRAAFPADADELLALFRSRTEFQTWMRDHRVDVARMSPDARRDAMWEARRRYFGTDADRIFAAVHRNEAIDESLAAIDANHEGSIGSRFGTLVGSIREQYGDSADAFLAERRQEVLDRFVGLNSVQADLAAMTPSQRSEALREVRVQSGMDEDALDRWDALDAQRDERAAIGTNYMRERAALESQYSGEALSQKIAELRARTFGAEAESIANEEAGGYFRFETARTFGVN